MLYTQVPYDSENQLYTSTPSDGAAEDRQQWGGVRRGVATGAVQAAEPAVWTERCVFEQPGVLVCR